MAKFCANCGAHMEDSDLVCGQCGTPSTSGGQDNGRNNSKKSGPILAILGGAVAVIIIIAIIINAVLASSGYKSTLDRMVKAIKNNDIAKLQDISSFVNDEVYGSRDYKEILKNFLDSKLDTYEDRIDGEVKKITYKITDDQKITARKIEKYKDRLSDIYDTDTSDIKNIIKLKLKLTIKGSKKSTSDNIDNLYLIKEGGKWRIFFDYDRVFN